MELFQTQHISKEPSYLVTKLILPFLALILLDFSICLIQTLGVILIVFSPSRATPNQSSSTFLPYQSQDALPQ